MGKPKKVKEEKESLSDEFGPEKKKKQPSLFSKIKEFLFPSSQLIAKKAPITFNVGIALILFFCYFSLMIVGGPAQPILFLLILPTLYILARYIKLERKRNERQQQE